MATMITDWARKKEKESAFLHMEMRITLRPPPLLLLDSQIGFFCLLHGRGKKMPKFLTAPTHTSVQSKKEEGAASPLFSVQRQKRDGSCKERADEREREKHLLCNECGIFQLLSKREWRRFYCPPSFPYVLCCVLLQTPLTHTDAKRHLSQSPHGRGIHAAHTTHENTSSKSISKV